MALPGRPRVCDLDNNLDGEFMHLYTVVKHCLRGVLSQFLDVQEEWCWCMEGEDSLCSVCRPCPMRGKRPVGHEFRLPQASFDEETGLTSSAIKYTGPREILCHDQLDENLERRFTHSMELMKSGCTFCWIMRYGECNPGGQGLCGRRMQWVMAKQRVLKRCGLGPGKERKKWIGDYDACF